MIIMKEMIDRIKELRKTLRLSQSEFAKALKLTRNSITMIETGKRGISDRTISDICREFEVNEEWLRNGTGEMFADKSNDIYYLIGKYGDGLSEKQKEIIISILKMDEAERNVVEAFIDSLIKLRNKSE
jgi:transcriptional regulator with XRE-family HTH domain